MIAMLGGLEMLFVLPLVAVGLLGTIFWIWMLVDCAMNESSQNNEKLVWVLIILFAHFIGAVVYFLVRRPKRLAMGP